MSTAPSPPEHEAIRPGKELSNDPADDGSQPNGEVGQRGDPEDQIGGVPGPLLHERQRLAIALVLGTRLLKHLLSRSNSGVPHPSPSQPLLFQRGTDLRQNKHLVQHGQVVGEEIRIRAEHILASFGA